MKLAQFALLAASALSHGDEELPINPALGVPGFPDCIRPATAVGTTVEEAAMELQCSQKAAPDGAIRIGW
jgi:hypothetical protein